MPHYYSESQKVEDLKKIKINVMGSTFELFSGKGVFSKDAIDLGSKILIENCIIDDGWEILDLGCGIGVVGISLKMRYPSVKVTMSEINDAAIKLSMMNVKMHKQDNKVVKSDMYSNIKDRFDAILLNPPQAAGKEVCMRMIADSKEHLKEGGVLQIVARHNKGGSEFEKKMAGIFGNCRQITKKSGYRVYLSSV